MWVREVILTVPACVGRKKRGREGRRGRLRVCGMRRRWVRGSEKRGGGGRAAMCTGGWRLWALGDAPPHKTRDQISAINSNHSSLVSSASFIIFRIIPFPIFSPGCIGIRVVRPSGCHMNRWLPFCLICRKPMFSNALITFLADRGLIESITQKLRLAGCQ